MQACSVEAPSPNLTGIVISDEKEQESSPELGTYTPEATIFFQKIGWLNMVIAKIYER